MKDFFISYTKADQAWAEWIAWTLEEAGYSTVIQAWDFRPGTNFVLMMKDAAEANRTIAVLSQKYLDSTFTQPEWAAAFKEDPEGKTQKLIPVRIAECNPPAMLSTISYVDVVGLPEKKAQAALLGAFSERAKPNVAPAFPVAPAPQSARVSPTRPTYPGAAGFGINLEKKTQDFCGRDWLFDNIKDWATAPPGLLIIGDPGAGKSTIIARLIQLKQLPILACYFFDANERQTLRPATFINDLAAQLANCCPEYEEMLQRHAAPSHRTASAPVLLNEEECDKNPRSAIKKFILTPLNNLCALPSLRALTEKGYSYILLDAIDEALSSEHKEQLLHGLQCLLGDDTPLFLRIIATSLNNHELTTTLLFSKIVDLNSYKNQSRMEVETYIKNRLAQIGLKEKLANSKINVDTVTHMLSAKADGNFLYARQAICSVTQLKNLALEDLKALRPGLGPLYLQFFQCQFKGKHFSPARQLLQVMVAAQEPLTKAELQEVTRLKSEVLSTALEDLKPYLSREADGKYKIYHESVRDWLTTPEREAGPFYTDLQKGYEQLTIFCFDDYRRARGNSAFRPPSLYTCRYGVKHLTMSKRYADAVELLDWLNRKRDPLLLERQKSFSEMVSRLPQFAKMIAIAMTEDPPTRAEAQKVDPRKLASILQPLYMTEALYGGIELLMLYHPETWWQEIFDNFLATQDYVLRYAISEVLGQTYLAEGNKTRLEDICKLAELSHVGKQEVAYHALRFIIARKPQLFRKSEKYIKLLADSSTYPGRCILGDLLLNLMLQTKDGRLSLRPDEIMGSVDHQSRFWNPIWRFQQMDVWALEATSHFLRDEPPPGAATDGVREAYKILDETEKKRTQLLAKLEGLGDMSVVSDLLSSYYKLGVVSNKDIRAALSGLTVKEESCLKSVFEVLFAFPLWEVVEKAASALASIVDDNPRLAEFIRGELFEHPVWRVRYGAAETAFLTSFDPRRGLFSDAVRRFYSEEEPLLRGNCAENVAAWILETESEEDRAKLLSGFQVQIECWLKDDDCWVLDHMYRLFWKLAQEQPGMSLEPLLRSGVSPLLKGEDGVWYLLDRRRFLARIERNKIGISPRC